MLSNATLPTTRMDMGFFLLQSLHRKTLRLCFSTVLAQQGSELLFDCFGNSFRTGKDCELQCGRAGTIALSRHSCNRGAYRLGGVGRILMQHGDHLIDSDGGMPIVPAIIV